MTRLALLLLPCLAGCVVSRPIDRSASPATVPEPDWTVLGRSVEGRPLRFATLGHGPRRVLWIGGIHGDEREASHTTAVLPANFHAAPTRPGRVTLGILEDVNPDGTAAGTRTNAGGVDLNRNYPAENFDRTNPRYGGEPLSQPEARVLHDLILDWNPDAVIVAHSWRDDHFINYDGPARDLAVLFSRQTGGDYRVRPSSSFSATPGSLGSWVGWTRGIPILTLEHERGTPPEEAWERTREAILAVIDGRKSPDP